MENLEFLLNLTKTEMNYQSMKVTMLFLLNCII